ncbi:hypothetical protein HWV62_45047 [Athelia sp. TMB]|nr:hypothetical protein HWV62_45047 [Athelia sp. TMB]
MANPYAPDESGDLIRQEEAVLIGDAVSLVAYGIVFSLCVLCLRALFGSRSHNPNRRRSWLLSSYVLAMFALATIFVTTNTKSLLEGLIQNRNYPGGPLAYWANGYARALTVVPNAASVISSWMADALLLYRCYIIFNGQPWVIAVPAAMYLGSASMGVMVLYQASRPSATLWTKLAVNFGLPYFIITVSLNVTISCLISMRLLVYRYRMHQAFPGGNSTTAPYASIASLLIESSALYAISSLLFIGPYAAGSYLSKVFLPILTQVQAISPLLIILRVADRRAWTIKTASVAPAPMQFGNTVGRQTDNTMADTVEPDVENGLKIHFSRPSRGSGKTTANDDTLMLPVINSAEEELPS